jgi:hypothetical protein
MGRDAQRRRQGHGCARPPFEGTTKGLTFGEPVTAYLLYNGSAS